MSILRPVILDLLPVYAAGEASPETRAMVEAALAEDPSLRAEVGAISALPEGFGEVPASMGLDALKRTQRLLRRRTVLTGVSVFLSTIPLALTGRHWGLAGNVSEVACLVAAAVGWAMFLKNAERLHALGFEGKRSIHSYSAWYAASCLFAASFCFCVEDVTGRQFGALTGLVFSLFWVPVYLLGQRLRQIHEPAELLGPKSLMDLARDEER